MGWATKAIIALNDSWVVSTVYYMISSKYRKSVKISEWLDEQIDQYKEHLIQIIDDQDWTKLPEDDRMVAILKWVKKNITYMSDQYQYKELEHWATIFEILTSKQDDCEGGACLMFCLARLTGIAPERIRIVCGWVYNPSTKEQDVGHCWVRYLSDKYPFISFYMDWCYYPDTRKIDSRPGYFDYKYPYNDKYGKWWFSANDKQGFGKFKW